MALSGIGWITPIRFFSGKFSLHPTKGIKIVSKKKRLLVLEICRPLK
jgi:hypothetical protein